MTTPDLFHPGLVVIRLFDSGRWSELRCSVTGVLEAQVFTDVELHHGITLMCCFERTGSLVWRPRSGLNLKLVTREEFDWLLVVLWLVQITWTDHVREALGAAHTRPATVAETWPFGMPNPCLPRPLREKRV